MLNEIHRFMLPNEGSIHFEFSQIFFYHYQHVVSSSLSLILIQFHCESD